MKRSELNIEKFRPYLKKLLMLFLASFSSMSFFIKSKKYNPVPKTHREKGIAGSLLGNIRFHLQKAVKTSDILWAVLMAAFYFLFSKTPEYKGTKGQKRFAVISSGIISFIFVLCESYALKGDWSLVFGSKYAAFFSIIKIIGFGAIIYSLLSVISNHNFSAASDYYVKKPFSMKKELLWYTGLFLVCWLPYMILLFPGCLSPDGADEVAQIAGNYKKCTTAQSVALLDPNVLYNTHHPLFYTLIIKLFLDLGRLVHSYSAGLELLCVFQCITVSLVFAYTIAVMKKYGARRSVITVTAAFLALNPLFSGYAMTIVKDTFSAAAMLLAIVLTYEILCVKSVSKSRLFWYFAAVFVFILTRNNCIYIMVLTMIVIAIALARRDRKRALRVCSAILCAALIFQVGLIGIINPALKITPGSKREMLSVPFQQTARYVKENRADVSKREEKAISGVLNLSLDEIAGRYNGLIADPVKNSFNKYATDDDIKAYLKDAWLVGLKKHPASYVQAYFELIYGWFGYNGKHQLTYAATRDKKAYKSLDGYHGYMGNKRIRHGISNIIISLTAFPLTAVFLKVASYTWAYLLLLVYAVRRKRKNALLAASIVYFNFLTCLAGPLVNTRYVIGAMCALPFVAFTVFKNDDKILIVNSKRKAMKNGKNKTDA